LYNLDSNSSMIPEEEDRWLIDCLLFNVQW
jgi:hypothetical protein